MNPSIPESHPSTCYCYKCAAIEVKSESKKTRGEIKAYPSANKHTEGYPDPAVNPYRVDIAIDGFAQMDGSGLVAKVYGKTGAKAKERADKIVTAVNEYDNLVKENAELRQWKEEQMEMTGPILDYMQKNSAKFNLKLGERIFKKVLQILEQSSIK